MKIFCFIFNQHDRASTNKNNSISNDIYVNLFFVCRYLIPKPPLNDWDIADMALNDWDIADMALNDWDIADMALNTNQSINLIQKLYYAIVLKKNLTMFTYIVWDFFFSQPILNISIRGDTYFIWILKKKSYLLHKYFPTLGEKASLKSSTVTEHS